MPKTTPTFKTLIKKVEGNKGSKCFYPVRMDTYGKGCSLGSCKYCYARNLMSKWGLWKTPVPVDIAEVAKMFHTIFETDRPHRYRKLLENRTRIRLGGMTDVFMYDDREKKVTYRFLQLLSKYDIPYLIITKSDLIAEPMYMDVLRTDLANIQFSVSTTNADALKKIEPLAPSPQKRLKAMATLRKNGFDANARVAPIILDDTQFFDLKHFSEILSYHPRTAIIEFIRISSWIKRSMPFLQDSLYPKFHAGYRFNDPELKMQIATEMKFMCDQHGVDFSVCDEESEFYERSKTLWANPENCCNINEKGWEHKS